LKEILYKIAEWTLSGFFGITLGVIFAKPITKLMKILKFYLRKLFNKSKLPLKKPELFHFGNLETPWLIVDGGIKGGQYSTESIKTSFNQRKLKLPPDLKKRYDEIKRREETKKKKGKTFQWNGKRYYLESYVNSRTPLDEYLTLDLRFGPSDYYTFQATNMSLNEKVSKNNKKRLLRGIYLKDVKWDKPVKFFSNSFGINLTVVTEDNYVIFTKRSENLGSRPNVYNISMCEGISASDSKITDPAPDLFRTAMRGLGEEIAEELALIVPKDDILFLSFGVDTEYSQWGLLGTVRVNATKTQIEKWRGRSTKDKWENIKVEYVTYKPKDVIKYVFSKEPWGPGALCCIYHTLIHDFDLIEINRLIDKYRK